MNINTRQLLNMNKVLQDVGYADNAVFRLLSQDEDGSIIADVTGDVAKRRYKFFPSGGRELLHRQDPELTEGTSEDDDDYPVHPHN